MEVFEKNIFMEYLREGRLIVTDSREVVPGSIFVALGGKKSDGHAYVLEAQKKGAVLALVGPQFLRPPELTIQTLRVTDPLYALQELAKLKRRLFAGFVIGITGSFGKTLVKDMLATLLGKSCVASPESYNSQLGVALSLLAMPLHAEFYVLELGVSQPGEMDRLIEMLAPDASIIVSIGDEHIEHFGSVQAIEREKRKILTPYLKWSLIPQSRTQAQIDIQTAMLHFEQSVPIRLFAPYHHYARCVELAIEAALLCNVTADCIVERILDFIPQNLALHLFRKEGVLLCVQPQGLKTLSYHRNERLATLFCARAAKELSHADNRLYVDLNAIASNISLLQKKCPIIASIKANAYGTDAVVMARFLRSCGVSAFLVAHLDEALELRQAGIEESILLLHCPQKHLEELLDANIEPFIGEKEDLAALSFLAQKKKINANVHLQIDTGMMRLGVKPIDAPGLAAYIKTLPNICLKGLCGHFAAADASEHDAFTGEQM